MQKHMGIFKFNQEGITLGKVLASTTTTSTVGLQDKKNGLRYKLGARITSKEKNTKKKIYVKN